MNALWLERLYEYRNSTLALESAKTLLELKDSRRAHLLARYGKETKIYAYAPCTSFEQVLLCEARNAKNFWRSYESLLPTWARPFSRKPRAKDSVNILLDISYHRLAQLVEKIISEKDISASIALIHRAHRAEAKPLVYDLMEMFRADVVDFTLIKYLRLKKKPIGSPQEHIGHLLHELQASQAKLYYLKDFKQCQTYGYYMDLQITKFIKAVNRREPFSPVLLPRRHDGRCKQRLTKDTKKDIVPIEDSSLTLASKTPPV